MLADLINDVEAAVRGRAIIGVPLDEEKYLPHPCLTKTCVVVSFCEGYGLGPRGNARHVDDVATSAVYWLEEHAERYGYTVTGAYVTSAILERVAA